MTCVLKVSKSVPSMKMKWRGSGNFGNISVPRICCFFQVQVRHHQWIPLLVAFVQKWGIDYVPVDIERSFVVVEEEQPIFEDQCDKFDRTVEEISNHCE